MSPFLYMPMIGLGVLIGVFIFVQLMGILITWYMGKDN